VTLEDRPVDPLRRLIDGYQLTQAIHVAATLGIPDLVAAGPRTAEELAAASGSDERSLYRVLRALASVGVFHEEDGRRFSSTPLSERLQTDQTGASTAGPPSWVVDRSGRRGATCFTACARARTRSGTSTGRMSGLTERTTRKRTPRSTVR
jgi:hypothetical protein